ncbi:putative uncharacterized protein DDB_G0284213 [Agrilus planipennis]|uniref:Uncharacterized protein n=1 Tax=Agrilus planipennis TaxID=224129 RepID=A0A1W4X7U9_AGRPL|nr:putative uncharacterized protein DDB_G0284213 [Agrilus planipennis]XP_018328913.1 putative uncharacterized protein DDB_G0284213 [Agrilus planipennis]
MSQEGSNAIREDSGPTGPTAPSPDPFQPKKQSKLIRILTVIAYMLSVSMAAIFLSAYYIFMYDAQPTLAQKTYPVANALTQGPNFHQYEQYVYIKEKKILKDKGLLTSNLIQSPIENAGNNTDENGENFIDTNNENNTDISSIDNKIKVENNLFETDVLNSSDNNNNIRFSLYRLYKRAMERNKGNDKKKMEKSVLPVSNPTENDTDLENSKLDKNTTKTKGRF